MRENKDRNKMKQGQPAIGTYVGIRDPGIVEMMGLAGFEAAEPGRGRELLVRRAEERLAQTFADGAAIGHGLERARSRT